MSSPASSPVQPKPSSVLTQAGSQLTAFTFLEKLFCVYALLYFSGGMGTVLGNPVLGQLMRYSIPLVSAILLGMRWRTSIFTLQKGRLLWLLILWLIFSVAWSLYPAYTLDAIKGEIFPYCFFTLYFASRFSMREQLQLVAIMLGINTLLCAFYAVAIPSVGKHVGDEFEGAWRGIYPEKNYFSGMTAITMLVYFILSFHNRDRLERRLARCGLGFAISLILLSTSITGLLVFLVLLITLLAFQKFRWQGKRSILTLDILSLLALITGLYIFNSWFEIVQDLGKDPTMSGRTLIWTGTLIQFQKRLWTGYGLEGFWHDDNIGAIQAGGLVHPGFVPAHAHNGFLDMLIEIGWIGFAIFMIGFAITLVMALKRAYGAKQPEDLWPLALLFLMILYNFTESWFIKHGNFFWVMYMSMFLSIRIWPQQPQVNRSIVTKDISPQ